MSGEWIPIEMAEDYDWDRAELRAMQRTAEESRQARVRPWLRRIVRAVAALAAMGGGGSPTRLPAALTHPTGAMPKRGQRGSQARGGDG